jgi:hypothetical protein
MVALQAVVQQTATPQSLPSLPRRSFRRPDSAFNQRFLWQGYAARAAVTRTCGRPGYQVVSWATVIMGEN